MSQVLHITNGDTLNAKIEASTTASSDCCSHADDRAIVEDLYLAALARLPTAREEGRLTAAWPMWKPAIARRRWSVCKSALPRRWRSRTPLVARTPWHGSTRRCARSPKGAAARRKAIEDLYWSVLSSKEFLFNH